MPVAQTETLSRLKSSANDAERELLIKYAKTTLSTADQRRLQFLIAQDIDWNWLVRVAQFAHGTFPLLVRHLRAAAPQLVLENPPFAEMDQQFSLLTVRNTQFAHELVRVSEALEALGIPVISYKGPVLAIQAYGDLSMRSHLDLDILVPRSRFVETQRTMVKLGYRPQNKLLSLEFMCSEYYQRLSIENSFVRDPRNPIEPKIWVDIHWRVAEPHELSFDFDYLLSRCVPVQLFGRNMRAFPPELLLLVLCSHGTKNRWRQMKWMVDIAELVRRTPDLDWDEVYKLAINKGISRQVDVALLASATALDAPVPETILARVKADQRLCSLTEKVIRSWTSSEVIANGLKTETYDTKSRRWNFVVNELFQPKLESYLRWRLPGFLFFLYYVIQPLLVVQDVVAARSKKVLGL